MDGIPVHIDDIVHAAQDGILRPRRPVQTVGRKRHAQACTAIFLRWIAGRPRPPPGNLEAAGLIGKAGALVDHADAVAAALRDADVQYAVVVAKDAQLRRVPTDAVLALGIGDRTSLADVLVVPHPELARLGVADDGHVRLRRALFPSEYGPVLRASGRMGLPGQARCVRRSR